MGGFLAADTSAVLGVADQLDPAPVRAAAAAAADARDLAPACGDPLPGCQAFTAAVTDVAGRILAFCDTAGQGIEAYASAARDSATGYGTADGAASKPFRAPGGAAWASLS